MKTVDAHARTLMSLGLLAGLATVAVLVAWTDADALALLTVPGFVVAALALPLGVLGGLIDGAEQGGWHRVRRVGLGVVSSLFFGYMTGAFAAWVLLGVGVAAVFVLSLF